MNFSIQESKQDFDVEISIVLGLWKKCLLPRLSGRVEAVCFFSFGSFYQGELCEVGQACGQTGSGLEGFVLQGVCSTDV